MLRILLLGAVLQVSRAARNSVISNIEPRRDTKGAIIDAHDGNVVRDPRTNLYLYFAAGYGDCVEPVGLNGCASWCDGCGCGFFNNHSVNVYSTSDLKTWTFHGNVLPLGPPRPNATLFSPKAIYNRGTGLWVLWYNMMPPYNYAVATSASPFGPFTTVTTTAALSTQFGRQFNDSNCGDFALFADDDGAGYIMYSSDHHVQIERLTADYLASTWESTAQTSGVFPYGNEAPAMFKRGRYYYALVSDSCCYCGQGGLVRAFMSESPLGPYTYTGCITAGPNPFHTGNISTSSQQTNAFPFGIDGQIIWQGDRWQSAPPPLRYKAQDFTTIFVLEFAPNGTVLPITWRDQVTVEF